MKIADEIRLSLADDWLPSIYERDIRSQRTRSCVIDVPKRENAAEIQYTLLGIELKVGRKRFSCPDLSTGRYFRIFARIGVGQFAIPYDITRISAAADSLETSWQRSLLLLEKYAEVGSTRARSSLVKAIRDAIAFIGSGDAMPTFDRETRQRPNT